MRHFMRPGNGYPGDPGADLPGLPAARTPLNDVYLVAENQMSGAPRTAKTITDYLWLDATVGKDLLKSARKLHLQDDGPSVRPASIRSVGMIQLGNADGYTRAILCPAATRELLVRWLGNPAEASENAESLLERITNRSKLSPGSIQDDVTSAFGKDRGERRARMMKHLRLLSPRDMADGKITADNLTQLISEQISEETAETDVQASIKVIHRELATRLRDGDAEVVSAIEAVRRLTRNIRKEEIRLRNKLSTLNIQEQTDKLIVDLRENATDSIRMIRIGTDYGENLLVACSVRAAAARCTYLCDQLAGVEDRLSQAATMLAQSIRLVSNGKSEASPWAGQPSAVQERVSSILDRLHKNTASPWLINLARESVTNMSPSAMVATINDIAFDVLNDVEGARTIAPLSSVSQSTDLSMSTTSPVSRSLSYSSEIGPHASSITTSKATNKAADSKNKLSTEDALDIVRPSLLGCGGQQRLILVGASESELRVYQSELQKVYDGEFTSVVIKGSCSFLIHEAQQIKVDDVLARLNTLNGGNSQVTERLLSRTDIQWYQPGGSQ